MSKTKTTAARTVQKTLFGGTDRVDSIGAHVRVIPNIVDAVARQFAAYRRKGGTLSFPEWHHKHGPAHRICNFCRV